MANDKLPKLVKYVEDLKNRLSSPPPAKRAHCPVQYREFLEREIATHSKKIDDLRMNEPVKK